MEAQQEARDRRLTATRRAGKYCLLPRSDLKTYIPKCFPPRFVLKRNVFKNDIPLEVRRERGRGAVLDLNRSGKKIQYALARNERSRNLPQIFGELPDWFARTVSGARGYPPKIDGGLE